MQALALLPLLPLLTVLAVLLHVLDATRVAGNQAPVARERWLGQSRRRPSCLCNTFVIPRVCAFVSRMRLSEEYAV